MERAVRRRFIAEYTTIRHAEGRGSDQSAYYQALPYRDISGKLQAQWEMRARTYRHFERKVLWEAERRLSRPLDILDLGAGNGWMSYRLSLRGHRAVALDIVTDAKDGLGARRHYPRVLAAVEAEFDRLPFPNARFDLIVYNASIHYSTDYRRTLLEAKRCLHSDAPLVILDSPVYLRREHGQRMLEERHASFERLYGFRSDAVPSIEFLDEAMLAGLARDLHIRWSRSHPWYGWRWAWRPWKARLLRQRPPSRFFILTGRFFDR
jgi:SAM-dependent methyltransferase